MYGWNDEAYEDFMFEVLSLLEPRREEKDEIIIDENEEVGEVLFFNTGVVAIGFEMNMKSKFVIKLQSITTSEISTAGVVINAYGCTFNERSEYTYKALAVCEGYSIRRKNWKLILMNHDAVADELKDQIKTEYHRKIRKILFKLKKAEERRFETRADY